MPGTLQGYNISSITAAVRMWFNDVAEEISNQLVYPQLGYTDHSPDTDEFTLEGLTGPTRAVLTGETEKYKEVDLYRGWPVTVKLHKLTASLSLSEESMHWILKAVNGGKQLSEVVSEDQLRETANSLNLGLDAEAADTFYLGFGATSSVNGGTGSVGTVGNSENLFQAHTLRKPGAATVRNTFSDNHWPLTSPYLSDGIDIMDRYRGPNDVEFNAVKNLRLIVAKGENRTTADRIVNSEYGPLGTDLGLNPSSKSSLSRKGINLDYVVSPHIPQATYELYWFLEDLDRAKRRLMMAVGWKPRLNSQEEVESGQKFNYGSAYFRTVKRSFEDTFGSTGTGNPI